MGTSGNPAKRAARPSSVKDFKKKMGGLLELPSGMVMKLKNPGIQGVMASGMMPNSLMGVVQKSLKTGQEMDPADIMGEGGVDLTIVGEMLEFLDKLMIICAVEPEVNPTPENEADRDDELLYVDEIDSDDKMFVFQWVSGGTTDLEQFRQRHSASVDLVGKVAEARGTSE